MTSIRLKPETKNRLKILQRAYGARSMDELLSKICDAYDYYNEKLVSEGEIMEDEEHEA